MKKIGIIGGGQLGRMLREAPTAARYTIGQLVPNLDCPCRKFSNLTVGDWQDADTVAAWGQGYDVVTVEWEHVSRVGLEKLETMGVEVYPQAGVLGVIADKGRQKEFYVERGLPTAEYMLWDGEGVLPEGVELPCVQKARTGGYDGQGVQVVREWGDLWPVPSVLEELVEIDREVSVVVARGVGGQMVHLPPVGMEFDPVANLVQCLYAPVGLAEDTLNKCVRVARETAAAYGVVGLLAVELFVTNEGRVLINEVAPRPHNSGHHTIEACNVSQYDLHLRAIAGEALPEPAQTFGGVAMVNILGGEGHGEAVWRGKSVLSEHPNATLHDYEKTMTKPYRKMGHVTVTAPTVAEAKAVALGVQRRLEVVPSAVSGVNS